MTEPSSPVPDGTPGPDVDGPRPTRAAVATLWAVVEGPDGPDEVDDFDDFDDAARRFMESLAASDPADAPREPSYAERVRAARQADLQRRLAAEADHARALAARDERARTTVSRRNRIVRFGAPALVVAIVGVAIWLSVGRGNDVIAGPPELRRPADWPSMDKSASSAPLGSPPPVPAEHGPFEFINSNDDGTPITWDPCRPIHYVVNPAGQLLGGDALIREAIERAAAATGLRFVDDGTTDETWSDERHEFQPSRYGDRWAPVLIVWSNGSAVTALAAPTAPEPVLVAGKVVGRRLLDPAGIGGPVAVGLDEANKAHVSGKIALDVDDLARLMGAPGGSDMVRAVIMHEIGHVLGLGHVDDPAQLMYEFGGNLTDWGPGDLRGLHALATGECHPEI